VNSRREAEKLHKRFAPTAIVAASVFLLGWIVPATDLASSPRGSGPVSAPHRADPYDAARARGAVVAILERRTTLRAGPSRTSRAVAALRRRTDFDSPRVLAVTGRRGDWLRVIATELANGGRGWIPMDAVALESSPWRVVADLSDRQVTDRRNGRLMRRFTVAVGGPATPTPTGRFAVTDKIRFTGGSQAYGCCAVALTGHQPNIAQGWSGGDRLAIHGTLQSTTIGFAASHGCLRARNEDARWLLDHLLLGTVVEFRD
jgi:lipoprotein-anchoring transpeptidase ErfK/SrfK